MIVNIILVFIYISLLKVKQIEYLSIINNICNLNNIPIWLDGGTLLGQ